MGNKYVFISNGTKPSPSERASREDLEFTNFSRPCLLVASDLGFDVYLGVNRDRPHELKGELGVKFYDATSYRSILDIPSNLKAMINLTRLLRSGGFELIHCNTPVGGLIGRLAGRFLSNRKIIYTAHGFHFYKGGPPIINAIYRIVESILARLTDAIITINNEDFEAASQFQLRHGGKVYRVPGVGIDYAAIRAEVSDRAIVRREIGVPADVFLFCSAGDLIPRKDHATAIRALACMGRSNTHLAICGDGPEGPRLRSLAKDLSVSNRVHFLGRRGDVVRIMKASDAFLSSSLQEGLPRAVMEAMAAGLPCVVSKIRGNVDLIEDGVSGYLCCAGSEKEFTDSMIRLFENGKQRAEMGNANIYRAGKYDVHEVQAKLREVYSEVLRI